MSQSASGKNESARLCVFPHRQENTAVLDKVRVPRKRTALFLALGNNVMHERLSDELSFGALTAPETATFQFLLYLTYCCKGELFQVTLENTDFCNMSPPVREDFAHGRLFCFVLNVDDKDMRDGEARRQDRGAGNSQSVWDRLDDGQSYGSQLCELMDADVDLDVFEHQQDSDVDQGDEEHTDEEHADDEERAPSPWDEKDTLEEAYRAFMRLQLVRKKLISVNNAMVLMRDRGNELTPMFECVDICSDSLNASKVDKKKVKEFQGSLFTPAVNGGKQAAALPEPIANLTLKDLDASLGKFTDCERNGEEGGRLFDSLIRDLMGTRWLRHKVVRSRYSSRAEDDAHFVQRLTQFAGDLAGRRGPSEVESRQLLVFRYAVADLIQAENPNMFAKSLMHRHVPVTQSRIDSVLRDIRKKRRTRALANQIRNCRCSCCRHSGRAGRQQAPGVCQTTYVCFYNCSEIHPFHASRDEQSFYFAQLYPHLGKLERLSKEMQFRNQGNKQFENIANMVFDILIRRQFSQGSLYEGLSDAIEEKPRNSSLSLGHSLPKIHLSLCLTGPHERNGRGRGDEGDGEGEEGEGEGGEEEEEDENRAGSQSMQHSHLHPLKVYDRALVRYLFCDSLNVGRLFQASTTFNYIVSNTAPRYTIERIMLFNVTGPGEGKSYANKVLNYQFRLVRGCIETLTSFTPQAFKYNQKRTACVVMIDDAHITHEKNTRAADKESNVIPNTFKNLLDTSTLESEVVTTDVSTGRTVTSKYTAVHNCGFVWNANTLGFVSEAWADRCLIMDSEFQKSVSRTRSTKQIQDIVESRRMDRIAAVCLYRQNLVQSATMIADPRIMQFSARFDRARDACVAALQRSHVTCGGALSRRASFCINQLVFAESMKLACHFVFDLWIPPWTRVPKERAYPRLGRYLKKLNKNRLKALDRLSFGQLCLEINAVYKLCAAACLPDICPRVLDSQGYFACKVLAYVVTQIHVQDLKTVLREGALCIRDMDRLDFSDSVIRGGSSTAHSLLALCPTCKVPGRGSKTYRLCTYKYATPQSAPSTGRSCQSKSSRRIASVTIPLQAVYDLLALFAPNSHAGFWRQLSEAMVSAYEYGGLGADGDESEDSFARSHENGPGTLTFELDFREDPIRSLILEATAEIEHLNELSFSRNPLNENSFRCSVPVHYGGVLVEEFSERAPDAAYNEAHQREAALGPRGTFHGPRLCVYSSDYSGVPVKNLSTCCLTRTVYHQDRVLLRADAGDRGHSTRLEEDWEWKDAVAVFDAVHGRGSFSVERLKRSYSATMIVANGEAENASSADTRGLDPVRALSASQGRAELRLRKGEAP